MSGRSIVIVLDGVGVGELPDAASYGDAGVNSLAHAARAVGGLRVPVLGRLGLGRILPLQGVDSVASPVASWGRMAQRSPGKDSTSGHWELMGCPLAAPFPTYPRGFPAAIIERFERESGRRVLGNRPASGTAIIDELGPEHVRTGAPIVYTSADSVFQIAAHEDVIPPEELYRLCEIARSILVPPHNVGRVIARPFTGAPDGFTRTPGRRDFSLPPPTPTLLDLLSAGGASVVTVGKVDDLFAGRGITRVVRTGDNDETMRQLGALAAEWAPEAGGSRGPAAAAGAENASYTFVIANLVDFDMRWGHRRDAVRYARGLETFDAWLGGFLPALQRGTLLVVTADHGCDPTSAGSDHTREYVPVLAAVMGADASSPLGTRRSFADVGATVADYFGVDLGCGESFLDALR